MKTFVSKKKIISSISCVRKAWAWVTFKFTSREKGVGRNHQMAILLILSLKSALQWNENNMLLWAAEGAKESLISINQN